MQRISITSDYRRDLSLTRNINLVLVANPDIDYIVQHELAKVEVLVGRGRIVVRTERPVSVLRYPKSNRILSVIEQEEKI